MILYIEILEINHGLCQTHFIISIRCDKHFHAGVFFTSSSLSPTLTPALAAGPSSDTLEMKIPCKPHQTHQDNKT